MSGSVPWRPLSFLAVCLVGVFGGLSVGFCFAVVGLVFVVYFRPVGFGLLAVTIKRSEWVFVLWSSACGTARCFYGWLVGFSGLSWQTVLSGSGLFQSGVVGLAVWAF
ncbi:MAG: hypothetical protein PHE96_12735 [Methylococcales bacterium]|nr:hypothetical protein [Methylococcales bacterium]